MLQRCLCIAVALPFVCSSILAARPAAAVCLAPPQREAPDPDPARFVQEIEAFKMADRTRHIPVGSVLLVGSSSIRLWNTAEAFPGMDTINRGFGGAHLSDVNHYIKDTVLRYEPGTVVLYAGDNDIAAGKSPRQVLGDFVAFRALLHNAHPQARILFISIKPSLNRWEHWPMMRAANKMIRRNVEDDPDVRFVDVSKHMLAPDGTPRKELFVDDGLHLNALGYKVWVALLNREFAALEKGAPQNVTTPAPTSSDRN